MELYSTWQYSVRIQGWGYFSYFSFVISSKWSSYLTIFLWFSFLKNVGSFCHSSSSSFKNFITLLKIEKRITELSDKHDIIYCLFLRLTCCCQLYRLFQIHLYLNISLFCTFCRLFLFQLGHFYLNPLLSIDSIYYHFLSFLL